MQDSDSFFINNMYIVIILNIKLYIFGFLPVKSAITSSSAHKVFENL